MLCNRQPKLLILNCDGFSNPTLVHPSTNHNHERNPKDVKNILFLLPPRMLMIKLPLRTVHPLRAWAAVTESTVFCPIHTLGQRPAQGVQFNLRHRTQGHMYISESHSFNHSHCQQNMETKKASQIWWSVSIFVDVRADLRIKVNYELFLSRTRILLRNPPPLMFCSSDLAWQTYDETKDEWDVFSDESETQLNRQLFLWLRRAWPRELFVPCSFRPPGSCEAESRIFVWQLQLLPTYARPTGVVFTCKP